MLGLMKAFEKIVFLRKAQIRNDIISDESSKTQYLQI